MHIDAVALSHLLAYRCEVVYVSGGETMEYRGEKFDMPVRAITV